MFLLPLAATAWLNLEKEGEEEAESAVVEVSDEEKGALYEKLGESVDEMDYEYKPETKEGKGAKKAAGKKEPEAKAEEKKPAPKKSAGKAAE